MSKKILIIGASSLIGQSLLKLLVQTEHQISITTFANQLDNKLVHKEYKVNILDITQLEIIKNYDTIINCTGQITNPINNCWQLNSQGITNIVDTVKKYNKYLIHLSSISVYGSSDFVDEDSPLNPETSYATMKCTSEFIITQSLTKYTILRISNLYGENQKKGIINYLVNSYKKKDLNLYFNNNGDLSRYYLNINDLSYIISAIIEQNKLGIYNISGPEKYSIKELVHLCESILNINFNVTYNNSQPIENIDSISSNQEISKLLPSEKLVTLEGYFKGIKNEKL